MIALLQSDISPYVLIPLSGGTTMMLDASAGSRLLVRWLPSKGRHAVTGVEDSWSEGPGLSVLAHVGMLVGVLVFSYAYAFAHV